MRDFSKGDFIVEYAGDLVELSEAKSREEIYKKDTSYGCYMYFFNHKGKSYWYVTLIISYLFFILKTVEVINPCKGGRVTPT